MLEVGVGGHPDWAGDQAQLVVDDLGEAHPAGLARAGPVGRGRCRVLCAMLIAAGVAMVAIAVVTLLVLLLEPDR